MKARKIWGPFGLSSLLHWWIASLCSGCGAPQSPSPMPMAPSPLTQGAEERQSDAALKDDATPSLQCETTEIETNATSDSWTWGQVANSEVPEEAVGRVKVKAWRSDSNPYATAAVEVFEGAEDEQPTTVVEFQDFQNRTPPPPTDIRLKQIYPANLENYSGYTLLIMEGGFTQMATARVDLVQDGKSIVRAYMTCDKVRAAPATIE